jgi:excisionase family DNA binding protein
MSAGGFLTPEQARLLTRGLFTFEEAAKYLGVHHAFIKNEVEQKRLKLTVIGGGKKRIARAVLDEYINERTGFVK